MNSYLNLVGQYGKVHKEKNRITVVCIAIAVCLVTAIFGMAEMEIQAQIISQIKTNGNWHVTFRKISERTAELIGSRGDVAVSGWCNSISGKAGYSIDGKPLAITGSEENIAKGMGLTVTEGHYPQKSNEGLLDRQALEQFSISIGDNLPVTYPDGSRHDFTIVGTYSDFSTLKEADVHGLIISYDCVKKISNSGSRYYVQFKGGSNMRRAIDEIKASYRLSDSQVSENAALIGLAGQSRDSYALDLYEVAAVLFVLVLLAGVLMIASSFNMNFLERMQFFGLMRCLGATKKQMKRFVLLEGLQFSLKGIPIGLLTGTLVVWGASAFLKYLNPTYFWDMPQFGISWISLVSGAIVGLLTVLLASLSPCRKAAKISPLCAVSGAIEKNDSSQAKATVNTKYANVEIMLGVHHAFSNRKSILLITGSFAMSIILFLAFSVSVDFMNQAIRPLKPYTPDLSIVSNDNSLSLPATLLQKIQANTGIKRAYGRMFSYDIPVESTVGDGKINLISYEQYQFDWAKNQLVEGSIDDVENGLDSVLVVYQKGLNWKVGDTLRLSLDSGEKAVRIAGFLSSSPFNSSVGTQNVICSEKAFQQLTGKFGYTILDIQLADTSDEKTISEIRSLISPQIKLSDLRQSNLEGKTAFYTYSIFIYGFLIIIALITVFNIMNSMNNSVSSRLKLYGMMRAVGMSGKQLHRMVTAEACTYALCGCIVGCALALPLHKTIFGMMITTHWGIAWQPPFLVLAVIISIAILSTFLSIIGPVKRVNRMDIFKIVNM